MQTKAFRLPKTRFSLRLFFFFFILIGAGLYLLMNALLGELKPGFRQAAEDTLVDSANLLAELAAPELLQNRLENGLFKQALNRYQDRELNATIWSITKTTTQLRLYITDAQGIVKFHTDPSQIGEDYSTWNDVYKTLRGEYGARSTILNPKDLTSTEMYVAAPILSEGNIIGALTLIKPNLSLQPFLDSSQNRMKQFGIWLILITLALGLTLSYWLSRSIRKLSRYAQEVSQGSSNAKLPELNDLELHQLAQAMAKMKSQLEGKDYVENYIHSLTHEMKSPVAAIKSAAELLETGLPATDQQHFIKLVHQESQRMERLISELLSLAALENQQSLNNIEKVNLKTIVESLKSALQMRLDGKSLTLTIQGEASVNGDHFLLKQAIENLIQNAIDFSPAHAEISVAMRTTTAGISISVTDQGSGIPEYAINKVFDRFYSLPRLDTGKKSSGLGLSFVQQICHLHQASCVLNPLPQGTEAIIHFPAKK